MFWHLSKEGTGILYAAITALLWGILAIALKISLQDVSAVDITWFRFTLAFISLSVYYYIKKPAYLRIFRKPPFLLILASISLGINYYGFIEGVNLTSPSVAQIFIQTGPVLLALSGFVFFREKLVFRQIIGFLLVISGLVLFYYEQIQFPEGNPRLFNTGLRWILLAALSWAVYAIILKLLIRRYPPMQLNLVIFGLPAILYLPLVDFTEFVNLSLSDWLIMVFLGLNTLFAYGTLSLAIQHIEANKVSVIIILNPIITLCIMGLISLAGVSWINHEYFTWLSILGAVIVLFGAVLTIFRPNKERNKRN
jgi:drug/metabolite transporter (DMT)-like permease